VLFIKIISLIILLAIFLQDWKGRAVYWFLFPLLAAAFIYLHIQQPGLSTDLVQSILINTGFIILQLILLTAYFSIKNKQWVNITSQLLGLGDVLFLLSIAFYLSVLNFLFFYIISLIAVLSIWTIWQMISKKKNQFIPLAGLQALIAMILLICDWWFESLSLTSDTFLLNLIAK
jgi:hypothetical protein